MMTTRQDRLKEVFAHVRYCHGVHTQTDFANILKMTRPAISAAMNGNEAYLTDSLFNKICAAFQGVFSLDYLLTGEGSLLLNQKEETKSEVVKHSALELSYIIESMDKKSEKTIEALEARVADLEARVRDKERIIQLLENENKGLKLDAERQRILSHSEVMSNFVSDAGTNQNDDL